MRILVVNAGSSSLKVDVVDNGQRIASYDGLPATLPHVDAVGHRIVHGGSVFADPVVVDDVVEGRLRDLVDLAPLHQPKSLHALDAARALLPDVPHVACFDTAFHATIPVAASTYALPQRWRERWPIRRYGFHGLSHAWATARVHELHPQVRRLVTCHLGAGASLAAVLDGRSVDTTMGFTPLEGLVMASRSGSVDPGLLLWLQVREGLAPGEIAHALEYDSGLVGLAGTGDMRTLLNRADESARTAVDIYLHRLVSSIAAMTAALGGMDCLVFTGGVGENAPAIRARTAKRLGYLGVAVDHDVNATTAADIDITAPDAAVRTLVVAAREDLQVAGLVQRLLQPAAT